jgi:type II secretory pathway component PulC
MKSSLWILTSTSAVLLFVILGYILFSVKHIGHTAPIISIEPSGKPQPLQSERLKPQDIKSIYAENDLFDTYKSLPIPQKVEPTVAALPQPPAPKPIIEPSIPEIQFLEPLPVTVSGIIISTNESKSHVTLVNNNTKESKSYKLGSKLFDAYIVRILPNKVILIRSNGQQEVLFKSPEDAQAEIKALKDVSWSDVIQKQSDTSYIINTTAFVARITNLAQLIDMLDATTAFKQNKSIGCHIGNMEQKSIGYALGLLPGDILVRINNIEPTTTENRVAIYNAIQELPPESTVILEIVRNDTLITNGYLLRKGPEFSTKLDTAAYLQTSATQQQQKKPTEYTADIEIESPTPEELAQQKYAFNSTIRDIEKRDKQAIRNYGSRRSVLRGLSH